MLADYPIAKGHLAVLHLLQTAVGDGDPEDVAAQAVEHLLTAPGGLAMDDPRDRPDVTRHVVE